MGGGPPPDALTTGEIPASDMDCEDPASHRPLLSYKDVVSGGNNSPPTDNNLDLDDDDDIELLEDDVLVGDSNGIPSIIFSERVQQLAIKSMNLALVVKVLGHRISYNTFHNRIFNIWKPSFPLKVMDIENDFFLVKFSDRQDYLKVLTQGPWIIFCHYLTVEPWSTDFQPSQATPSRLMAWIRLLGLPVTLYKRNFIEVIGNQIGKFFKIDFQTDNGCRDSTTSALVPLQDPPPTDPYGPWMLVGRRKRNSRKQSSVNPMISESRDIVHAINPIFEHSIPAQDPPPLPSIKESIIESSNDHDSSAFISESIPSTTVGPVTKDKSKLRGKSVTTITKIPNMPIGPNKGIVVVPKSLKFQHAPPKPSLQGLRGQSRMDASSSRQPQSLPKSLGFDATKHQAVNLWMESIPRFLYQQLQVLRITMASRP
ncbi:hypothetical protein V6N12_058123 [Hibiscus sabdariffa]|uniref:DUF4283 domain-containing protein n=1 Tax=Hibiscus sabdariffa TaxID=183260 RepID=A0ABR2ARN4_9ROSI